MLTRMLADICRFMAVQANHALRTPAPPIRLGKLGDLEFLFEAHLKAAAAGHFSSDYLYPHTHASLRQQLASSIGQRQCAGSSGPLASSIYVHEDGGAATGFCWVREVAGSTARQQEIYAVFVHPGQRGQGIAPALVRHVLKQFPASTGFMARLFPVSTVMDKILRRMGFEYHPQAPGQTIRLQRAPATPAGLLGIPGPGSAVPDKWQRHSLPLHPRQP